jgi:hypothetical protein
MIAPDIAPGAQRKMWTAIAVICALGLAILAGAVLWPSHHIDLSAKACAEWQNQTPDSVARTNPLSHAIAVAQAADDADAGTNASVKAAADDLRSSATALADNTTKANQSAFANAERSLVSACRAAGY